VVEMVEDCLDVLDKVIEFDKVVRKYCHLLIDKKYCMFELMLEKLGI
jgi:hypothetical protein